MIAAYSGTLRQRYKGGDYLRMAAVETRPREFLHLKPLPCVGSYTISDGDQISSIFLGPERMTVQERDDGNCIARGLVPILLRDDIVPGLMAAMKSADSRLNIYKSWSGQIITDRNRGLYDNLSKVFLWAGKPYAKKEIYESLRLRGTSASPYHGMVNAMERFLGLQVRGLLIELADSPTQFSQVLGAAILVAKTEYAPKWKLTVKQPKAIKAVKGSQEAQLVKCTMDELMGIAFVTELPILMSTNLYNSAVVDGLISKSEDSSRTLVTAPYFSSEQELRLWRLEQVRQEKLSQQAARNAPRVMKANEIPDASTFLRLKTSEKRTILRASGLIDLPRPREGPQAVDALIIPLLDEEVAYEVLRRLAETRGDFAMAAEMKDFESRKPLLAKQIGEARRAGNFELAKELCDELNALSTLKFDPTNPDGVAGEWDVSSFPAFVKITAWLHVFTTSNHVLK